MTTPFLDPALIISRLQDVLVAPYALATIAEIGNPANFRDQSYLTAPTALLILPEQTVARGPDGIGNGRFIVDQFGVIIQIYLASTRPSATDQPTLRAWRGAVFNALDGYQLAQDWAHLRYLGGERADSGDDEAYRWIEHFQSETSVPVRFTE